jgi:hypothetical protein
MTKESLPGWYWIVSGLAVLWEAMGCFAFFMQTRMGPAEFERMPPAQAEIIKAIPSWVTAVYALAVLSGFLAASGLLLRSRFARPLAFVSLAAIVVQFGWTFLGSPVLRVMGPSSTIFPAVIFALGALLAWFTGVALRRRWLA